jgi:hypothetical protein
VETAKKEILSPECSGNEPKGAEKELAQGNLLLIQEWEHD